MRRPAYLAALTRQQNLCVNIRHARMCRIYKDNDPLAIIYRSLNKLSLRYWSSGSGLLAHGRDECLALSQRERLLLCRFRAMILEYRKHGFALDRLEAVAPATQFPQSISHMFVKALAYPFEYSRPRWKGRCRKALRVVAPYHLPKISKRHPFFRTAFQAEVPQLSGNAAQPDGKSHNSIQNTSRTIPPSLPPHTASLNPPTPRPPCEPHQSSAIRHQPTQP